MMKNVSKANNIDETLTFNEVCRKLRINRSQAYKLDSAGKFPAGFYIGHRRRWRNDVVERWIDNQIQLGKRNW